MARSLNLLTLVGTLVQDPETIALGDDNSVTRFTISGTEHVIGDDGKEHHPGWYHQVSVFGRYGTWLAERLMAGSVVFVRGRLNYRTWETAEKERRHALGVIGEHVELLEYGPRGEEPISKDSKDQPRLKLARNEVLVSGNLTRDAESTTTAGGRSRTSFTLAFNHDYRRRDGTQVTQPNYVTVICWNELAQAAAVLKKGARVIALGRLTNDSWTDSATNTTRYDTRITADTLEFGLNAVSTSVPEGLAEGAPPAEDAPENLPGGDEPLSL